MPILMYHQVSSRPVPALARYTVTPVAFAAQMRWIACAGYTPISLTRLVEHRLGRADLPRKPLVLTFDDGYRELLDRAVPILLARGFTATIFLVAGQAARTSAWLGGEAARLPLLSWREARELESAGFHLGGHTLSHPRLTTLSTEACRSELQESRRELEDRLGHQVLDLAYPFGAYDARIRAIAVEVGYRSACSTRPGLSPPDDDLFALHRISVYGNESLLTFACRLRTSRSPRELWRRRVRRTSVPRPAR